MLYHDYITVIRRECHRTFKMMMNQVGQNHRKFTLTLILRIQVTLGTHVVGSFFVIHSLSFTIYPFKKGIWKHVEIIEWYISASSSIIIISSSIIIIIISSWPTGEGCQGKEVGIITCNLSVSPSPSPSMSHITVQCTLNVVQCHHHQCHLINRSA